MALDQQMYQDIGLEATSENSRWEEEEKRPGKFEHVDIIAFVHFSLLCYRANPSPKSPESRCADSMALLMFLLTSFLLFLLAA